MRELERRLQGHGRNDEAAPLGSGVNLYQEDQTTNPKPTEVSMKWLALAFSISLIQGCVYLPVFQQFQGARTLDPGTFELQPSYSSVSFSAHGETEKVQSQLGLRLGVGISPKADVRASYMRLSFPDIDESLSYLSFGPKFSLYSPDTDKVAVYSPFSVLYGDALIETDIDLSPTLLVTPASWESEGLRLDTNASIGTQIPLSGDGRETLLTFTFGLGIASTTSSSSWAIHPEFAIIRNPGEEGTGRSVGVSLSFGSSPRPTD